ncbi:peptidase M24, structural domain-containing protein [Russula brevipes]|nr:peptidase M24, structural domain-containing protein [Russula brevipes]
MGLENSEPPALPRSRARPASRWRIFKFVTHLYSHCAHIQPTAESSSLHRQRALASALCAFNVSAYMAEPGATAAYFANISGSAWGLSERPYGGDGYGAQDPHAYGATTAVARIAILAPQFEATRAGLLPVPASRTHGVSYITWADDADPYEVAVAALSAPRADADPDPDLGSSSSASRVIFVDGSLRHFIVDGLARTASRVRVAIVPEEIRRLRERKSSDELESSNLIDCGGSLYGYKSDRDEDESTPTKRHVTLWNLVHEAQALAVNAAHAGAVTGAVDYAARDFLKGFGIAHFTHRLGHGHESPYLRGSFDVVFEVGHTFSNGPGIYIEGEVGVRIEDCFYIGHDMKAVYLTAVVGKPPTFPWLL